LPDEALAALIFGITYLIIASERVDKTAAALAGAVVMIALHPGGFGQSEAFAAIDFNVIFLLAGMMIIVHVLSHSGVFQWMGVHSVRMAGGSATRLLIILALITAVLSAFMDNVTTIVLVAPVTLFVTGSLGLRPAPFLIAEVLASNIGGSATLIGDPPNILIGSAAGLTFVDFLVNVMPVIVLILAIYLLLVPRLFRHHLEASREAWERVAGIERAGLITNPRLLVIAGGVLALTITGFALQQVLGLEPATVALAGAAAVLILGRQDPQAVLREIEWSTLMFFVGLFIVVGGVESVGLLQDIGEGISDLTGSNQTAATLSILGLSALASGVVDNIPYTTAMIPVVREVGVDIGGNGGSGNVLWWSLSLGACLGGNLTLIAASANVLMANLAKRANDEVGFWEFFRYGAFVTVLSVGVAAPYLWLRYLAF